MSTIVELFERQAAQSPAQPAVQDKDKQIAYLDLNRQANQIARAIRRKCRQQAEEPATAALLFAHGPDMVTGILGVLKAGLAYVALDPEYPPERLAYLIEDSASRFIITNSGSLQQAEALAEMAPGRVVIDVDSIGAKEPGDNLDLAIKPEQAAYIMYTSGSTGLPKGVVQSHRNVVHFLSGYSKELSLDKTDRVALFTSYSHTVSVIDLFSALFVGATVYPYAIRLEGSMERLSRWLKEERITVYHSVPTVYRYLMETLAKDESFGDIRLVILGGEAVHKKDAELYKKHFGPECIFVNLFGSSEVLIAASFLADRETEITGETVPAGWPVEGVEVYILDEKDEETPVYGSGEIVYRSSYLADGYWRRKDKTAEVFVKNPLTGKGLVYRSGDMGRMLPDGSIEYLGRKDFQVKIRGYRVETAEIEAALDRMEGVKKSVVALTKRERHEPCLTAYYETTTVARIDPGLFRRALQQKFPDYMIPAVFVHLEKLPLTPNGKVDRQALPEPEGGREAGVSYQAPVNEGQRKLVKIWQEVLGIERVGIDDNFFNLGGHSLKATTLIARIHQEFEAELSLKEVFLNPTIRDLSEQVARAEESRFTSIQPVAEAETYPVSASQRRMYLLNLLEGVSTSFNVPHIFVLEGRLDRNRLEAAFRMLFQRHEILRTSFHMIDGEPVQKVGTEAGFQISMLEAGEERIKELIREFVRPFDLSRAPLLRVALVKTEDEKHLLLFDVHHIIADGTSMGILVREFAALYQGEALAPLPIQYKDFSAWQNELIKTARLNKRRNYWSQALAGELPLLDMPLDNKRDNRRSFAGSAVRFVLAAPLTLELEQLAQRQNTTLNTVLYAAYAVLLSRYSGQQDLIIGTLAAGRMHPDLENLVGVFTNLLPIRNHIDPDLSFRDLVDATAQRTLEAFENQDYPFEKILEDLNYKNDPSRNPLFDTMLSFHNENERGLKIMLGELKLSRYRGEAGENTATLDFWLDIFPSEAKELLCKLEFNTKLFNQTTMERLARHFQVLLARLTAAPQKKIGETDLVTEDESRLLLEEFNDTALPYPREKTVPQLFEEQAEKTPDRIALVFSDQRLTYRELNKKANCLAATLRARNVKPDSIVGIMAERSTEMIIGVLAVIKAGGAYLPIDPEYPAERIRYLLEDSRAEILLTQKHLRDKISLGQAVISLDDPKVYRGSGENLPLVNKPQDLLYVIYTSGTTGKPKGVMIEQQSFVNATYAWKKEYKLEDFDVRLLQLASFSFDVFAGDLSRALLNGGQLIICPAEARIDPPQLYALIRQHGVNIWESTPALVTTFMEYVYENSLAVDQMKLLIAGSDICPIEDYKKLLVRFGRQMRIVNSYGLTEATIDSSYYEQPLEKLPDFGGTPIGKPLPNTAFYILDGNLRLAPVGVYGELCIAGAGLARGYYNREELTAERFIPNPFVPGTRIYRTGDLARWLPDGNVEFSGRADSQIKIRGFRIEIGEIENCLLQLPAIKEAVVAAYGDPQGQRYLAAYFAGEREINAEELKQHLLQELPNYMIPACFIQLERLPLTPNGKIDRKALPLPEQAASDAAPYTAPRSALEERLALVWQKVLAAEQIGIDDNFFDMGGNSLKVMTCVFQINKELKLELPVLILYNAPTIRELADYLSKTTALVSAPVEILAGKRDESADRNDGADRDEGIVLIRKGEAPDQNVFFIHDGSGDIGGYLQLCSNLAPAFNYWGIKLAGSAGSGAREITIETLAQNYLDKVRNVQAHGPYHLAGWSHGAVIACEMCRLLEQLQEGVGSLVFIDPHMPDVKPLQAQAGMPQRLDIDAVRTISKAVCSYLPAGRNKTRVHVFKAAESSFVDDTNWELYFEEPIQAYELAGDHFSLMTSPYVKTLAGMYRDLLGGEGA